jgi:hypothetical protein
VPLRTLDRISLGFEKASQRISLADINPLRLVTDAIKKSPKYAQITSSIREIGLVEPPVVVPEKDSDGKFLLLDGHLRLSVLREMGEQEVVCLISTDDEAFTYNRRVNRIAIIQEHRMIVKAIERGVAEERLAKVLNVDVSNIQRKRRLLEGICPEAAELLKDKHIAIHALWQLKKLRPFRQMEAAELMVAMNKYTISYARSLVAASSPAQLVDHKYKRVRGLTSEQTGLMERESATLDQEFRSAQQSYGSDHLDLVLAKGYVAKLLNNTNVVRHLAKFQPEFLAEFQKITGTERT